MKRLAPIRSTMPTLSSQTPLSRSTLLLPGLAALTPLILMTALGLMAAMPNLQWYADLHRPSIHLPVWLIGPVWELLYALVAGGFYRVLRRPDWMPDRPAAIRAFLVQLGLNAAWPLLFFGLRSPGGALVSILALLVAVASVLRLFRLVDRRAGLFVLPYLLWVAYVAVLNLSIYIRN